ncbi:30S ribosomal protein S21 [bacterium]|nr:30S ribosomal protein S21 [bacterium]MBL7052539.1 30S ribosomal protein S21 [Candidatus Neomarinimicrobiota bacterium]
MVQVLIKEGEPVERALRRFKKQWEKAGIHGELRRREYFVKPTEARRLRKKLNRVTARRNARFLNG